MNRYSVKFIFVFLLIPVICLSCKCNALADSGTFSWYCVHRKDHLQPEIAEEFRFCADLDGYYIDKKHSDDNYEKVVYLTFDAGYENGNIEKILNIMAEENVRGAFFILGNLLEKNSDLVKRMFDDGHLVCNHTYSHRSMTGLEREEFNDELKRLENACFDSIGKTIDRYYRPPEGKFDRNSLQYAKELGYKTIFWSFAYEDWDNNMQLSADKAKKKILDNIHNGEIMLLHPTSATNAAILREVIIALKNDGYRFATLDEL